MTANVPWCHERLSRVHSWISESAVPAPPPHPMAIKPATAAPHQNLLDLILFPSLLGTRRKGPRGSTLVYLAQTFRHSKPTIPSSSNLRCFSPDSESILGPQPGSHHPSSATSHPKKKKEALLKEGLPKNQKAPASRGLSLSAPPGTRTPNLLIKSQLLCQLS
jgi:hypothetical protein